MTDCIFCRIAKKTSPAQIVYENDKVVAFLDITPDAPGHTLVIPKNHFENFIDTPVEDLLEVMRVVKKIAPAIMRATGANAFNIGVNNGEAAGQIIRHMHVHIIPRKFNDGLVMWEGKSYEEGEMEEYGEKIRLEVSNLKTY